VAYRRLIYNVTRKKEYPPQTVLSTSLERSLNQPCSGYVQCVIAFRQSFTGAFTLLLVSTLGI